MLTETFRGVPIDADGGATVGGVHYQKSYVDAERDAEAIESSTTILATPHGLHRAVPNEVYHARIPGLVSKSALDLIDRSPAHYKAWLDGHDEEETPALKFGRAFHCALLEPERFENAFAAEPDFGDCRKKENKAARDDWRAAHGGIELVSLDEMTAIIGMRRSVRLHPLAAKMMRNGDAEITLRWRDDATDLECKARADYYVPGLRMVADVKTTLDASRDAFRRDIAKHRYHVQDALYRAAFATIGEPVEHFVFVAVEKAPPYAVAIYTLDAESVSRGYNAARGDIECMAECVRRNEWPGYPVEIQTLDVPPWAA